MSSPSMPHMLRLAWPHQSSCNLTSQTEIPCQMACITTIRCCASPHAGTRDNRLSGPACLVMQQLFLRHWQWSAGLHNHVHIPRKPFPVQQNPGRSPAPNEYCRRAQLHGVKQSKGSLSSLVLDTYMSILADIWVESCALSMRCWQAD